MCLTCPAYALTGNVDDVVVLRQLWQEFCVPPTTYISSAWHDRAVAAVLDRYCICRDRVHGWLLTSLVAGDYTHELPICHAPLVVSVYYLPRSTVHPVSHPPAPLSPAAAHVVFILRARGLWNCGGHHRVMIERWMAHCPVQAALLKYDIMRCRSILVSSCARKSSQSSGGQSRRVRSHNQTRHLSFYDEIFLICCLTGVLHLSDVSCSAVH